MITVLEHGYTTPGYSSNRVIRNEITLAYPFEQGVVKKVIQDIKFKRFKYLILLW